MDPNHRTFIVSDVLNETGPDGQDCSLSAGDVVTRIEDTPDANKSVKVLVSASQKSDCASGSQVSVAVDDLQEMHNHFREQLDSGLKTLADNQGKNGLPAAPDTKTRANPDGQVKPDTSVKATWMRSKRMRTRPKLTCKRQAGDQLVRATTKRAKLTVAVRESQHREAANRIGASVVEAADARDSAS